MSRSTRLGGVAAARRLAGAVLLAAAGVASGVLASGCAESAIMAAGATAGFGLAQGQAESFIRGELKAARRVPIDVARQAVRDALGEVQVEVRHERQGVYDGYIRGRAEGGREIKISLKADSPMITRFSIRVGIMGDRAVSSLVMTQIDDALGLENPLTPTTRDAEDVGY